MECGLDAATRYRDQAVLVIAFSQATSGNYLQCKQSIDGNDWYGKRMRFSCQIKTEGVEAHATLAVSIKSPSGQMVVYDPMIDRSLRGDNDWTEVSVVVDVPDDGRWIVYGPCLWGAGKMWVADFKVQQVSRDTPRTDDHGSTLMLGAKAGQSALCRCAGRASRSRGFGSFAWLMLASQCMCWASSVEGTV